MSASNAQSQIELHKALAPRYAYRYSLPFSRLFQEDWHRQMLQHLPAQARRVLDLGCGTGFFLAELEALRPGAVGLDISHEMLRVSEQYVPGARLVTADAERLPFVERSFDAVFCKGSLHHTRDHVRFLSNCARALSDEGVLIMSEPCNDNPLIRLARYVLYKFSPHFDLGDQGFTKKGLIALCEQAGFEVHSCERYGVFAYTFGGFPDHLGVLRFVPFNTAVMRGLLALDRVLCAIPGLDLLGFQLTIACRPRRQA
jgi:ubiquinone/menaquinone biosynthesis C-methylase UbiE